MSTRRRCGVHGRLEDALPCSDPPMYRVARNSQEIGQGQRKTVPFGQSVRHAAKFKEV
ncbi:hypothetical protein BVI1335_780011 [Burkholderia vietnamiensis]|nr:hypothetical protein BVI1335_780011 [Burkholderia vietnamiensis]